MKTMHRLSGLTRTRKAALGVAVAVAVAGGATVGVAAANADTGTSHAATAAAAVSSSSSGSTSKSAKTEDGSRRLCRNMPVTRRRLQLELRRLDGTKNGKRHGEIANLQKRISAAKSAGHTAVATFLTDELNRAQHSHTDALKEQTDLKGVKTYCKSLPQTKSSKKSSSSGNS
ncbi:hypothetical protein BIV57_06830 [Mangrovactinospora gilvigrisea]|uniref:Uncharacterized protein n=1 Tax=Mangrovactinospora gilvigrisea TaxID=1428644 RepID=A0A1J7BHS1_9ACTN|nr:hypothetical protein [Mangrovactinospora gilvigrisea]OIV38243.1 hypothetical protein BIV57_06830 [Mangrovactinospora gilvigrisea]